MASFSPLRPATVSSNSSVTSRRVGGVEGRGGLFPDQDVVIAPPMLSQTNSVVMAGGADVEAAPAEPPSWCAAAAHAGTRHGQVAPRASRGSSSNGSGSYFTSRAGHGVHDSAKQDAAAAAANASPFSVPSVSSDGGDSDDRQPWTWLRLPNVLMALAWFLSVTSLITVCYAISDFDAVTWIVGSAAWSALYEIVFLLCSLFLLAAGFVVMTSEKRVRTIHDGLRGPSNLQCRLSSTLAMPALLLTVYVCLAFTCLLSMPATNAFIEQHAHDVFARADVDESQGLSYYEFAEYTLSLQANANSNTTQFRLRMALVFDEMDANHDGTVLRSDMYEGVKRGLMPERERLGRGAAYLSFATMAFTTLYFVWVVRVVQRRQKV